MVADRYRGQCLEAFCASLRSISAMNKSIRKRRIKYKRGKLTVVGTIFFFLFTLSLSLSLLMYVHCPASFNGVYRQIRPPRPIAYIRTPLFALVNLRKLKPRIKSPTLITFHRNVPSIRFNRTLLHPCNGAVRDMLYRV